MLPEGTPASAISLRSKQNGHQHRPLRVSRLDLSFATVPQETERVAFLSLRCISQGKMTGHCFWGAPTWARVGGFQEV